MVEGAVLTSQWTDADLNCTIIFRTKSTLQHFVMRFEELKLGCNDHLTLYDGDSVYGQPSIKDYSCRDSLASVQPIKTNTTFLAVQFSTDNKSKQGDGFRLIITATIDPHYYHCPVDYSICRDGLCISKSLFCDSVNHCLDNSDEEKCSLGKDGDKIGMFPFELTLANALGLLLVLVLVIFTCIIIFISLVYCRRENQYAQFQHQLQQRVVGVPLQSVILLPPSSYSSPTVQSCSMSKSRRYFEENRCNTTDL